MRSEELLDHVASDLACDFRKSDGSCAETKGVEIVDGRALCREHRRFVLARKEGPRTSWGDVVSGFDESELTAIAAAACTVASALELLAARRRSIQPETARALAETLRSGMRGHAHSQLKAAATSRTP